MGITTFSGPIRAGTINTTTGTTLGENVRNIGSVVMVQTVPITQAGTATALATDIVLPVNSHILSMQMLNTAAWSGANTNATVGVTVAANELVPVETAMNVGINQLTPSTNATAAAIWDDTGTGDRRVWFKSVNTGTGVGTLTVRYIQSHDLQSSP